MTPEKVAIAATFYFGQAFVFWCKLISKNVLEWFLLIMCKEHTLNISANFPSNNHPTLCFRFNFMIRSECQESCNKFLDTYFFSLQKYLFRTFPDIYFHGMNRGLRTPLSNQVPQLFSAPRTPFQPLNVKYDPLKQS